MNALTRVVASLQNRGIAPTLRVIHAFAVDALFDVRHGVRTGGWVELEGLDVVSDNKEQGVFYQPVKSALFLSAMRFFSIPPDGAFVDFGSGKGRALMLAIQHGFRRVVGVEFAQELHCQAEHNLERFRARTGRQVDVQVLNVDATRYPITAEDRVFFMYNPFHQDILVQVLHNIRSSFLAEPRPIHIVYANPVHRRVLDDDPFWVKAGEIHSGDLEPFVHYRPRVAPRMA